jgi:YHS domain-containing protein
MFAFIERLIFFLFALSALRSGFLFVHRLLGGFGGRERNPVRTPPRSQSQTTMLQQDPVCGTYVAIETSLKRICNGKVVHFCSPECRDRYRV